VKQHIVVIVGYSWTCYDPKSLGLTSVKGFDASKIFLPIQTVRVWSAR